MGRTTLKNNNKEDVNILEDVENRGNSANTETEKTSDTTTENSETVVQASEVDDKVENATAENSETVVQVSEVDNTTLATLSKYSKLYPKNKVFHITSDGQVFLDANKRDAEKHQKDLGKGELKSYSVQ